MEILFMIVLVLVTGASAFVAKVQYDKCLKYEKIASNNYDFIVEVQKVFLTHYEHMCSIDHKGTFEADDEVGYFFTELKELMIDIKQFLEFSPQIETADDITTEQGGD